jgi:hypothetical protein
MNNDLEIKSNPLARFDALKENNSLDLINMSEEMVKPQTFIIYPRDLDKKVVHKMIINLNHTEWKDGPYGVRNQYAEWKAYSMGVVYKKRIIYDRVPFIFQVPFKSWCKMMFLYTGRRFSSLLQALYSEYNGEIPLIEIHFKRNTETGYELKMLGLIRCLEVTEENFKWERFKTLYSDSKYQERGTKVIKQE